MNSLQTDVPIFMRWKVSKEEIRLKLQNEMAVYNHVKIEELPGVEYGLVIEKTEENEILVSLAFQMKEPTTIKAKFKISLISLTSFGVYSDEQIFVRDSHRWGEIVCKYEEFFDPANNHLIDNFFYITLEGILSFEKEHIREEIKIRKNLGELLYNRDDKDFDIYSGNGKYVKVHKLIISAKSLVFERMIQSGLKEARENKVLIIDFDYEIIEIAIKFCYGISITNQLNVSNGIKLLQFSDKYDISDLKDSMETYLINKKSPLNICEIVNASILYNSIKLREKCFDFMLECVKKQEYIKDLESLDKEFALHLIKYSFSCF